MNDNEYSKADAAHAARVEDFHERELRERREKEAWLKSLKVGDKVVVCHHHPYGTGKAEPAAVARLSPTSVWVTVDSHEVKHERRFKRESGDCNSDRMSWLGRDGDMFVMAVREDAERERLQAVVREVVTRSVDNTEIRDVEALRAVAEVIALVRKPGGAATWLALRNGVELVMGDLYGVYSDMIYEPSVMRPWWKALHPVVKALGWKMPRDIDGEAVLSNPDDEPDEVS